MSRLIDLTGKKIGKLTVLEKAPSVNGKTRWKCLCDCGKTTIVGAQKLKYQTTISCGCYGKNRIGEITRKGTQYSVDGNIAMCVTSSGQKFLIDAEDAEDVCRISWAINELGYLHGWNPETQKYVMLHRYILKLDSNKYVDHINRNPRDNRKSNLRICTKNENAQNMSISSRNTSGYTGVYRERKNGRWFSRITYHNQVISLGTYGSFEEAVLKRFEAEQKYFGEFAPHTWQDVEDAIRNHNQEGPGA